MICYELSDNMLLYLLKKIIEIKFAALICLGVLLVFGFSCSRDTLTVKSKESDQITETSDKNLLQKKILQMILCLSEICLPE